MTGLQRRVARLTVLFPPTVERDPIAEIQVLALQELSTEELRTLQVLLLRGGEYIPVNDAERLALDHYREALLAVANERGVAA